ncbi:hypothetical protein [Escherichia phage BI-EHEC]|nr:hypothetical protein [Escherichia phage BI-EHEC]
MPNTCGKMLIVLRSFPLSFVIVNLKRIVSEHAHCNTCHFWIKGGVVIHVNYCLTRCFGMCC